MDGLELFPDVEMLACQGLRMALGARAEPYCADVHVGNFLPDPRPARAVIVRHDGGRRTGPVTMNARLGINVWAGSREESGALARVVASLACSALPSPIEHVEELASFTEIADPSEQSRRYGTFLAIVGPATPLT